jgi:hypothetical protein
MSAESGGLQSGREPARTLLHRRSFEFAGYARADGLYDIEGRMTDRKTYAFPNAWRGEIAADEPLHDMRARLTLDDEFRIVAAAVETAAAPYAVCAAITPAFAALEGETIGRGWTQLLRRKFGGVAGCTHHVELLRNLATVAFQTIYAEQQRRKRGAGAESRQPVSRRDASRQGASQQGEPGQGESQVHDREPAQRPAFIDTCHALAAEGEVVKQHWPAFHRPRSNA